MTVECESIMPRKLITLSHLEQELERLRREHEKGLYMGKNEAKVFQRMKEIKDQILLVEEKDADWPEEAVWTSCVVGVATSSFDWDDGTTVTHGVCSKCEGTGFRLQLRKRINVNDA